MQIAVFDADLAKAEWICQMLAPLPYSCRPLQSSTAWLQQLDDGGCDLFVLASQEPDGGIGILHAVRHQRPALPVLFIAGCDTEDDIVAAMAAGASDYIVQPLRRGEFRLRVRTLLLRAYPDHATTEQTRIGPYLFDHRTLRVAMSNGTADLTQKEFDLALLFFRHLGRPLSRAFIRESIWMREADVPSRTVDTHVSRVRSKLRLHPENGFRLLPVYSFGYRLEQINQDNQSLQETMQ